MTKPLLHMPRPCDPTDKSGACPFRVDAEPGEFPAERFELLADTAGLPGAEVPIGGKMFACHHTADGAPVACAGWLRVCGSQHLSVRMAVAERRLSPEALVQQPGDPDLFGSYDEMATQQSAGVYNPRAAARSRDRAGHNLSMIVKLTSPGSGLRAVTEQCERGLDVEARGSGGRDALADGWHPDQAPAGPPEHLDAPGADGRYSHWQGA